MPPPRPFFNLDNQGFGFGRCRAHNACNKSINQSLTYDARNSTDDGRTDQQIYLPVEMQFYISVMLLGLPDDLHFCNLKCFCKFLFVNLRLFVSVRLLVSAPVSVSLPVSAFVCVSVHLCLFLSICVCLCHYVFLSV